MRDRIKHCLFLFVLLVMITLFRVANIGQERPKFDYYGTVDHLGVHEKWNMEEEDFSLQPFKVISFDISFLEVKTDATRVILHIAPDEYYNYQTRDNCLLEVKGEFRFFQDRVKEKAFLKFAIELVPAIIQCKGIQVRYSVFFKEIMKSPKIDSVLIRNYESMMVEAFENRSTGSRILVKIVPMIEEIFPAKEIEDTKTDFDIGHSALLFNDRVVFRTEELRSFITKHQFYLFVKDKGLYVISFHPFPGALPNGVCKGNTMKIKVENDCINWLFTNSKKFFPEGKWRIWVRHNPKFSEKDLWAMKHCQGYSGIIHWNSVNWKEFFE